MLLSDEEREDCKRIDYDIMYLRSQVLKNTNQVEDQVEALWNINDSIKRLEAVKASVFAGAMRRSEHWRDYATIQTHKILTEPPAGAEPSPADYLTKMYSQMAGTGSYPPYGGFPNYPGKP
jgi:hypothetical protein